MEELVKRIKESTDNEEKKSSMIKLIDRIKYHRYDLIIDNIEMMEIYDIIISNPEYLELSKERELKIINGIELV